MKKAVAAQVSLFAVALASVAFADGPPAGATLRASFDGAAGSAIHYSGGVVSTPQYTSGGKTVLGAPTMSPLHVTVSTGMASGFYDWITQTLVGSPLTHKLALASVDAGGKIVGGVAVHDALLSSATFPALNHTDTSPATIDVSIWAPANAVSTNPEAAASSEIRSAWLRSNFTIDAAGLPSPVAMSSVALAFPRDAASGQATGKMQIGAMHLYFDGANKAAIDTWRAQNHATDVKVVYMASSLKSERTPIYELDLKGCMPNGEAFSGTVDVTLACSGAVFKRSL